MNRSMISRIRFIRLPIVTELTKLTIRGIVRNESKSRLHHRSSGPKRNRRLKGPSNTKRLRQ